MINFGDGFNIKSVANTCQSVIDIGRKLFEKQNVLFFIDAHCSSGVAAQEEGTKCGWNRGEIA